MEWGQRQHSGSALACHVAEFLETPDAMLQIGEMDVGDLCEAEKEWYGICCGHATA